MRRSIIAVTTLTLATATSAFAEPTISVSYSRAELQNEAYAVALYERVVEAAETVCHETNRFDPDPRAATAWCVERAVAIAIEEENAPELTAASRGESVPAISIAAR
jgi:UrcA family protein